MKLFDKRQPQSTPERLKKMLMENLPRTAHRAEILPETTLRELGLDSLGLILVVTRFCEEFNVNMAVLEENIGELRTVDDLLNAGERIVTLHGDGG